MILYNLKERCSGCSACYAICPKKAITMISDEEGFLYPKIDTNKCIDCGVCQTVCMYSDKASYVVMNNPINCYIGKSKQPEILKMSRSGGAFAEIARYFLNNNGVVYGCELDDNFLARHNRIIMQDELHCLQGSKYIQSDPKGVYQLVERDLLDSKRVLYSGTACQIGGLLNYLSKRKIDCKNLITCDIICHGVGSPLVWRDNLDYIEHKMNRKIKQVNFRDKQFGWERHIESYILENGKKYCGNYFTLLFYFSYIIRPSCHNCLYCKKNRIADITLADAWGAEKICDKQELENGMSLIMINTTLGKDIMNKVEHQLEYVEVDLSLADQPNLNHPTLANQQRSIFWNDYKSLSFSQIVRKYAQGDMLHQLKRKLSWKSKTI